VHGSALPFVAVDRASATVSAARARVDERGRAHRPYASAHKAARGTTTAAPAAVPRFASSAQRSPKLTRAVTKQRSTKFTSSSESGSVAQRQSAIVLLFTAR
jgi:hypothetical protein